MNTPTTQPTTELTVAQKFVQKVEQHFAAELGQTVQWTPLQMALAQHLYTKVDMSLKEHQSKGKMITWSNVNMSKLAIDGVAIVNLGIDATIKNHLNVIPYKNGALSKAKGETVYDLALRPGYEGALYAKKRGSLHPIVSIEYKLIFKGDHFKPLFAQGAKAGDDYEYAPADPFGTSEDYIGGFGFIRYEDPRLSKLVLVTMRDFARSEKASKSKGTSETDQETGEVVTTGNFWTASRVEMGEKTVAWRTCDAIQLDPEKINASSYAYVEAAQLDAIEGAMAAEIEEKANGQVLSMTEPRPPAPAVMDKEDSEAEEPQAAKSPVKAREVTSESSEPAEAPQTPAETQGEPDPAEVPF
jgi:hypothetical protein